MAGLKEFYCGSNEPSHASQFKWLEYTFKYHSYRTAKYANARSDHVTFVKTLVEMYLTELSNTVYWWLRW
jgi:hypothetical protein